MDGPHLNYLKSSCHSVSQAKLGNSLAPERPLSLRKNYLCTLFPQGMWLTPISILFWWKHTSQKTSKIRFHSPDCCILPSEWLCPPKPQAVSPLLNGVQEVPWRHSPCCASPQAPFSSHIYSTDCNIGGGPQGFHAQCRGCPRVWTPRRTNITTCQPCEPGQWLKLAVPRFSICKMRVTVPQPIETLWELGTIHANTLNCTWCLLSTKYMLLLMIIMETSSQKVCLSSRLHVPVGSHSRRTWDSCNIQVCDFFSCNWFTEATPNIEDFQEKYFCLLNSHAWLRSSFLRVLLRIRIWQSVPGPPLISRTGTDRSLRNWGSTHPED